MFAFQNRRRLASHVGGTASFSPPSAVSVERANAEDLLRPAWVKPQLAFGKACSRASVLLASFWAHTVRWRRDLATASCRSSPQGCSQAQQAAGLIRGCLQVPSTDPPERATLSTSRCYVVIDADNNDAGMAGSSASVTSSRSSRSPSGRALMPSILYGRSSSCRESGCPSLSTIPTAAATHGPSR